MIVSLAARVYNAAKSHVCGNYYNDVNCAEELVGKEFEVSFLMNNFIVILFAFRHRVKNVLIVS